MRIEIIAVITELLILSGVIAMNFIGQKKEIAKVMVLLWGTLCGGSTLLALFQIMKGVSEKISIVSIWLCLLSWMGLVILSYARKYERRMLGLYALIMNGVAMFDLIFTMLNPADKPPGPLELLIVTVILMGYTSMTVLFCLSMVAGRRPAKVKRWIRISFVSLGAGILLKVLYEFSLQGSWKEWPLEASLNMVIMAWLLLCAFLHRKKMDAKTVCLIPFGFVVAGMLIRYEAKLLLVALLGGGIGAAIVMIKQLKLKLPEVNWKSSRILMRVITYGYIVILFLGTLFPFLAGASLWGRFYMLITIVYCVFLILLLIIDQPRLTRLQYAVAVVLDTVITIVGMVLFREIAFYTVILLWIVFFPIIMYFLQSIENRKEIHSLQHLMCAVSLLGAIAILCGGLGVVVYAFFIGGTGVVAITIYSLFFGNL